MGSSQTYSAKVIHQLIPVLAGKITLADFYKIIAICRGLDESIGKDCLVGPCQDVDEDKYQGLSVWLRLAQPHLPVRSHSKITRTKLTRFIWGRSWFQVKDFATYFSIHTKTAWEYLQKLEEANLLTHNQQKSSRVRYRVNLPA